MTLKSYQWVRLAEDGSLPGHAPVMKRNQALRRRRSMIAIEPATAAGIETVSCALVITQRNHGEILVLGDKPPYRLPSVQIPRWERPAPHINEAVRRLWGIESICLFAAEATSDSGTADRGRCFVLEARGSGACAGRRCFWMRVGD
jgi:hypothetical protein